MSTRHVGSCARSSAAAVMPSWPGISMSSSATSGLDRIASWTTRSPRSTWATTSMSASVESSAARAPRIIAWSSAIRTRITPGARRAQSTDGQFARRRQPRREDHPDAHPGFRLGSNLELASGQLDALPEADQPGAAAVKRGCAPAVVDELQLGAAVCTRQHQHALLRPAVLQDVGHSFPEAPGEDRVLLGRDPSQGVLDEETDPGGAQRIAGVADLHGQAPPAVAGSRLAYVVERFACNPSEIAQLLAGRLVGVCRALFGVGLSFSDQPRE